ncbi:MAG: TraB/GumN family protein [Bacteroidota bacterium]
MKNLFKLAILVITFGFGLTTNAQTKPIEKSLLWEVSGKRLTKPSYLFGTVHMICEKDYILRPKVTEALAKTTKLALEVNLADPNEIAYMQKASIGAELLSKRLTPTQLTNLENILQKQAGISVKQIDNFTMMTVMSLLSMKSFGCQNLKLYEMELITKAKENKKDIIGLETIKDQMDFLDKSYSDEKMLDYFKYINEAETQKLVQNYVDENLMGIYQDVTNPNTMDANGKKWMLDVRNTNWVKQMPELMQKESVFFAVGSGHLAGDTGLINLLRKEGYTVKPVMN